MVESDETWRIGGNRHKLVEGSQSENIQGDKDILVEGSHAECINGVMNLKVEAMRQTQILGSDHLIVDADQTDLVTGNWTRKVRRNIRVESEAHQQFTAPGTIFIDAGDKVVLRAGSVISFNVGGNFIRIDDGGIQIEGTIVDVNTGGGAPAKGKDVPFIEPVEPRKYQGPYARRYQRSFQR